MNIPPPLPLSTKKLSLKEGEHVFIGNPKTETLYFNKLSAKSPYITALLILMLALLIDYRKKNNE